MAAQPIERLSIRNKDGGQIILPAELNSLKEMYVQNLTFRLDRCAIPNLGKLVIGVITDKDARLPRPEDCMQLHELDLGDTAIGNILDLSQYSFPDLTKLKYIPRDQIIFPVELLRRMNLSIYAVEYKLGAL